MKCSLRNPQKAQKKWLAGAAANHLSDSPAFFPHRNRIRREEHRLKSVPLGRKRAAAATVARRIGILEDEPLAHQRLFVLERRAVQIQETFRIDEEARAEFLENLVAVAGLRVQPHGIGEAGATAALNANAQAANIGRHTFLCKQCADFQRGPLGEVDFRDVWTCYFCCHDQMLQMPLCFYRAKQERSKQRHYKGGASNCHRTKLSATPFRGPGLRRRVFSSSRRWPP